MRVFITGGYGCIGSWIVRNLLERGDEIWIYDLQEDTHRLRLLLNDEQIHCVNFIAGDVTDLACLRAAIRANQITHVIHLAGLQVPVCRADPLRGAKVNVLGTLGRVRGGSSGRWASAASGLRQLRRGVRPTGAVWQWTITRRCAAGPVNPLRRFQVLQ